MVRPLHCCQQRKKASEPQCFTLSLQWHPWFCYWALFYTSKGSRIW
jgi:hypothetical protein